MVGVGMGPQHVTPEASEALHAASYAVAARKSEDDPLLAVRREICRLHGDLEVVAVADPERDRAPASDGYAVAVADWHDRRVDAYTEVIRSRTGDPAFLVWGDPSLYDSTIRVAGAVADRLGGALTVVPGISAPQLLAARHGIVLHEVGRPVHITTARRLGQAVAGGQDNIVVMLGAEPELSGLEDWHIWWGANLGTGTEALVSGRVGEVAAEIASTRERVRDAAGWAMDAYLLRRAR